MTAAVIEPAIPTEPACRTCAAPAVVHWQRRLLPAEIAAEQAIEQARRDERQTAYDQLVASVDGADPPVSLPPKPEFGPMPGFLDATATVYACAAHAIPIGPAALIHQATCTGCDCTPEPPPEPEPEPEPVQLPPGW